MTNEMGYILTAATGGVESCGIEAGGLAGAVSRIGVPHRPEGDSH
jgi:hypothetical protein